VARTIAKTTRRQLFASAIGIRLNSLREAVVLCDV